MFILLALFVFALSYVLTPVAMCLAERIGAVDVPSDGRRMHSKRMPRDGGIAIILPFLLGLFLLGESDVHLRSVAWGAALILMLGLADDIFCLSAFAKFFFQSAIALAVLLGSGTLNQEMLFPAMLWVVALTNAHNMIDGMDGLLCGCSGIEGGLLGGTLLLSGYMTEGACVFLLAIACWGFRCFNRYPAKIFAGDCGSETIGFLLGVLSLSLFHVDQGVFSFLSPLFLFAYPLIELVTTVLRRILNGRSPFLPDRAHLHHRLYAMGLSQKACCGVLMSVTLVTGGIGLLMTLESLWIFASVLSLAAAFFLLCLRVYVSDAKQGREN